MIIKIRVEAEGAMSVKPRDAQIAMRQEFQKIGETWHKKHRARHFTLDGVRRYSYTPRSRKYNRVKRKKFGHTLPLVFSGTSRILSKIGRVNVTKSRSTGGFSAAITMPVRVFNFKPRGSSVNMLREFRTISDDEVRLYETQAQRNLERKIARHRKLTEIYG